MHGSPPARACTVPIGASPAGRAVHSAGCPLICVIAAAGIDAKRSPPSSCSATSVAVAPSGSARGAHRLQAGAIRARLCGRLRRELAQFDFELSSRDRSPATPCSATVLKACEVRLGHVHDDLGLTLVRNGESPAGPRRRPVRLRASRSSRHRRSMRAARCNSPGCARVRACAPRPRRPRAS